MKKSLLFIALCTCIYTTKAQSLTEIWGITEKGGNGIGTMFKTDNNGDNQITLNPFKGEITGKNPGSKFCEAPNGKLYSVMSGGIYDEGVIMELNPVTGELRKKTDFDFWESGSYPIGLTLANGKLYGISLNYHYFKQENASIFEYDVTTNTITKKVDFTGSKEFEPVGDLLLATNGKLYGLRNGGFAGHPELYEYDPVTNSIVKKISFEDMTSAAAPLVQAADGKIYGMTLSGGASYSGTIYEYDLSSNSMTTKYTFGENNNGSLPFGGLEIGNDGLLYGMTYMGEGRSVDGVLFKFDPSNSVYTKIIDFDRATTGAMPQGTLKKGSNGLLYGMTGKGGANGKGTVFELNPLTSGFTKLLDFDQLNGNFPLSSFVLASNGKLYASTYEGGKGNAGVVFEYDIQSQTYKKLADLFNDTDNGKYPTGTMSQAENGKIYVVSPYGGKADEGMLMECDPRINNGSFTKKIDFKQDKNGSHPVFAPIQSVTGKLYGTTKTGGTYNEGTLYEYDIATSTLITKINFKEDPSGYQPTSGLVRAFNEKLYGLTQQGGVYNSGTLFEFDPLNGVCAKVVDCPFSNMGGGYITVSQNRNLYVVTDQTVFEYDIMNNNLITKAPLGSFANGADPCGSLAESKSGKLYGLTTQGGISSGGTIFEYDPATNLQKKIYDFTDSNNGWFPNGSLLFARNNKLYGTTSSGGLYGRGVMFEFDPTTGIFTKKIDFNGANGMSPQCSNLLEVCKSIAYQDLPSSTSVCESTSFIIKSGITKSGHTFQWYINPGDTPIPFATSEDLSITSAKLSDAGTYTCKVSNGCTTIHTVNKQIVVLPLGDINCVGVGVNENSTGLQFKMYPNPASDDVHLLISDPSTKYIRIELVNILGQSVYKEERNLTNGENRLSIPLGNLKKGIYYLKIMDSDWKMIKNEKLIKN